MQGELPGKELLLVASTLELIETIQNFQETNYFRQADMNRVIYLILVAAHLGIAEVSACLNRGLLFMGRKLPEYW